MTRKILNCLFIALFVKTAFITLDAQDQNSTTIELVKEMQYALVDEVLKPWYPRTIDNEYGGFLTDFNYKWELDGPQNKMLVSQTRHVWSTSTMDEFLNDKKYLEYAEHGYEFLRDKMWDKDNGGFYFLRNREGNPISGIPVEKNSYSNAFAIYSLAAYYKISKDESALDLAKATFIWLEEHAHDPVNKGYFDLLSEDGSIRKVPNPKRGDQYLVDPSWKDQNSSIHLLEAFTLLYSVYPDSLLKERLSEMLSIVRDKIVNKTGYLSLYLTNNWQPLSFKDSSEQIRKANYYLDHVSFGHDVETAYLMLEASHVLGIENDTKTIAITKKMVDHSLKNGWDPEKGGFYYEGYYFKGKDKLEIINPEKVWWVQAEGLNALLLMSKLFPEEEKYYDNFLKQWEYIKAYMIDHEHGGWYGAGLDESPQMATAPKAYDWKVNYHTVRALMNCIKRLTEEK